MVTALMGLLIMRDKEKLNLSQLDKVVETSKIRNAFSLGLRTVEGGGGGIGASVAIITALTLVGITAAFIVELLAAVAGAVLFAVLALGLTYYRIWKDEQKLKGLKEDLDKKIAELKRSVLDSMRNYQLLLETEHHINEEIVRLGLLLEQIKDNEEKAHIEQKIEDLKEDRESLAATKKELIERLVATFSIVDGANINEKLQMLFGQSDDSVHNFALLDTHYQDEDLSRVKFGFNAILPKLREDQAGANFHIYRDQLGEDYIKPKKIEMHTGVKWLTTALAGLGGLLGGSGSVITIAAVILGSMAAVTAVGWPIAVAALGVGLIAAGIAMYYQHRIETRQQRVLNKLNIASSQVAGMTSYLNEKVNKPTMINVTKIENQYQDACRDIAIRLDEHKRIFRNYQTEISQHDQKIKSLHSEVNKFHSFVPTQLEQAQDLQTKLQEDILLLTALLKQVHKVAIVAGSELEKTNLIQEIETLLAQVSKDKKEAAEIYEKIYKALHQPALTVSPKAESKSQKPSEDKKDEPSATQGPAE